MQYLQHLHNKVVPSLYRLKQQTLLDCIISIGISDIHNVVSCFSICTAKSVTASGVAVTTATLFLQASTVSEQLSSAVQVCDYLEHCFHRSSPRARQRQNASQALAFVNKEGLYAVYNGLDGEITILRTYRANETSWASDMHVNWGSEWSA